MTRLCRILAALAVCAGASVLADDFPKPHNSEPGNPSPISPAEALASFKMPPGFRVSLFAAEPDVQNPIAMAWDARGRLWVAENYTYAERTQRFEMGLRDRVLIFEDTDNDGKHDKRTVFTDEVQCLTSVEVGGGGVWLMCPSQLIFLPDRDGDDKPDGPAEVVLDGFTVPAENYHNFANGLRWGPDGWLYGRCGASAPGDVGPPGTPIDKRIPLRGGIWRYHPTRKVFENIASGTTNPWGHDWDAKGELFFINTVNGHLWHAVPGMHYVRPHTIDPNPRVYELIDQHADHWHWDNAKDWTDSRNVSGEHDRRGGGHAHSGMTIYQGDNWPAEYRGKLLTLNLHGRRINMDRLERSGSGFVGKHEPDPLFVGDPWFRGIDLGYGPDGGVYVLDWSDTGECHDSTGVHRTSGRIYKITHGDPKRDDASEWNRRMARRRLADRGPSPTDPRLLIRPQLLRNLNRKFADPLVLDDLWSLMALGADESDCEIIRKCLDYKSESVRAWGIRALTDHLPLDTVLGVRPSDDPPADGELLAMLHKLAREDDSGLVRLVLASTLQRLPHRDRPALAKALMERSADADDHNLPLLIWYGLSPLAEAMPDELAALAASGAWPTTNRLIARSLAEQIKTKPEPLDAMVKPLLADASGVLPIAILDGISQGLKGWRKAPKPADWDALAAKFADSTNPSVRERIRELGVLFGDGRALDEVRKLALDGKADLQTRRAALLALIDSRPDDLRKTCEQLLGVRFLNTTAVRGLTLFDDPAIGKSLANSYKSFHPSERGAVIDALVARPAFVVALLDGIAAKKIPREDLNAFQARQIRSFNDADLSKKLADAWGELRDSDADRKQAIADWKGRLTDEMLTRADRSRGRAVFNKICASCHTLYGQGGSVGPDLTGAGRDNLDYLLENILDPSAVVTADYRMVVVATTDGRVLNGIVRSKNDRTTTLQMQNEAVTLENSAVEETRPSNSSLMPDGLLSPLTEEETRDLIAYLKQKAQVPLPPDASK